MELLVPSTSLIVFSAFCFVFLLLWAYTLRDVIRNRFAGENEKLIWVILVVFVPVAGMLFYFLSGRKNKINL